MDLDLRYYRLRGIYILNGIRVVVLPRGSLELMQDYVANILGLATKSIFEEVMATTIHSFLTDLIKTKQLKLRDEEESEYELFSLFKRMGFGTINAVSKDVDSYSVTIDKGFNSIIGLSKGFNYCFQATGLLKAVYRILLEKEVAVTELKCKTTGNSDIDWFEVKVLGENATYNYAQVPPCDLKGQGYEKIEVLLSDTAGAIINSMPVEIIPVIFFPYIFNKLRRIIGMGAYGIQYGMGTTMSKLYIPYPFGNIAIKYRVQGFEILSPLAGVGLVKNIKGDRGGLKELDIFESFNALKLSPEKEKRCSLLSGILTGLSYLFMGTQLKIREIDCSAINNSVCRFSFE
jgi:predicted hydrocarbon binding protein